MTSPLRGPLLTLWPPPVPAKVRLHRFDYNV
jgi:hypothetical protein